MPAWFYCLIFICAPMSWITLNHFSHKRTDEPVWELYEEKSFTKKTTTTRSTSNWTGSLTL